MMARRVTGGSVTERLGARQEQLRRDEPAPCGALRDDTGGGYCPQGDGAGEHGRVAAVRILVVNSFFPPLTTGSAHFSLDVAREYVRDGHEVTVVTTRVIGAADEELRDGIRIVRLPALVVTPGNLAFNYALPFVSRPGALRTLRRLFDEVGPDVVHQNGQFFDLTFVSTWVAWRRRIPRVLTLHTPLVHTRPWSRRFIALVDRTVVRRLERARRSDDGGRRPVRLRARSAPVPSAPPGAVHPRHLARRPVRRG